MQAGLLQLLRLLTVTCSLRLLTAMGACKLILLVLQVDLLAQFKGVNPAVELPDTFQSQAQDHWYQTQLPFNTTQLVQDLCLMLDTMGIPYQKGIPASTGLLLIDIALPDRQVGKVADASAGLRRCLTVCLSDSSSSHQQRPGSTNDRW